MLLSFPGSCGLPVQQGKASASVLMSCPEFLFNYFKKTYFYVQNLHVVIYLIFCIVSLNWFIVRIVFLLHAVIFFACCFTLVCRNKSPTGLMLHVCEYSTENKISMSMSKSTTISAYFKLKLFQNN